MGDQSRTLCCRRFFFAPLHHEGHQEDAEEVHCCTGYPATPSSDWFFICRGDKIVTVHITLRPKTRRGQEKQRSYDEGVMMLRRSGLEKIDEGVGRASEIFRCFCSSSLVHVYETKPAYHMKSEAQSKSPNAMAC